MKRYVLLLRHGTVDRSKNAPDRLQPLKNRGKDLRVVANVLAEHLNLLSEEEKILIGEIWSGTYKHTEQSAKIIYNTLKKKVKDFQPREFRKCRALDPDNFMVSTDKREQQKLGSRLLENKEDDKIHTSNAILVVGHAPQISWIAERILRKPFPIARAELACIGISDFWLDLLFMRDRWVAWTIWNSDAEPELKKDLYAKIDSKMKLAGILGGLIIGVLTFLLKSLLDTTYISKLTDSAQIALFLSAAFFFVALGLYLGTMYSYDRLMMPIRYWAERSQRKERKWLIQRPPGSAMWVIYQNMIRIWNWLFTPATWAVIAGLLTLAFAVFQPDIITSLVVVCILLLSVLYYRHFRPVLGTDD